MRLSIPLVLLLAYAPSGFGQDKEKKDTFVLPLEVGMKWTYDTKGKTDSLVMVAERKKEVGKKTGIEMIAKVNGVASMSEVMLVEKDKLFRIAFQGLEVDPPLELFQFSGKQGDEWSREFTVMGTKVKTDFSLKIEDVEVPLGKYKSARVVKANADDGTHKVVSTVWYVSGVGMVKQIVSLDGNEIVDLELTKFEKPEK
jgi:hypothetical protein